MKRLLLWNIFGTVLMISTIGLCASLCTSCSTRENDEFILKKEDKEVKLVGLTKIGKTKQELIIPHEVTYIDTNSFNECHASILNFTNVDSERVTICKCSFANFKNIEEYIIRYNDLLMGKKLIDAKADASKIFVLATTSDVSKDIWNNLSVTAKILIILTISTPCVCGGICVCRSYWKRKE